MNPTESLKDLQKAELEAAVALNQVLFRGYEQLTQLQMQTMRLMAQQAAQTLQSAVGKGEVPSAPGADWADAARAGGENVMSYVEKFGQIASATQAEMTEILQSRLERLQNSLHDSLGQNASAAAPAGVEPMQALLQSTMNWTTQAINTLQDTQQQAVRLMNAQTPKPTAAASRTSASSAARRK
ncbi:MAG: phasin family protein [Betaproteobacteria bacterium]|nr:phasin family protein [Betaproteobacteria bacterium]